MTTLSIIGAAVVFFGAMGVASTLQVWYQRVYDQPPAWKPARQLANRFLWLGGLVLYLTVQNFSWTHLKPGLASASTWALWWVACGSSAVRRRLLI